MKCVPHFKIERNIGSGSRILSGSSYSAKPLKKKSTEKEKIVKFLRNTSSDIQVISTFNRTVMNLPRNIYFLHCWKIRYVCLIDIRNRPRRKSYCSRVSYR